MGRAKSLVTPVEPLRQANRRYVGGTYNYSLLTIVNNYSIAELGCQVVLSSRLIGEESKKVRLFNRERSFC